MTTWLLLEDVRDWQSGVSRLITHRSARSAAIGGGAQFGTSLALAAAVKVAHESTMSMLDCIELVCRGTAHDIDEHRRIGRIVPRALTDVHRRGGKGTP